MSKTYKLADVELFVFSEYVNQNPSNGIKYYDGDCKFNGNIVLFNMDKFDFDWGYAEYRDAYAKLNYLACMAFQCYQEVMGEKGIRNISDINKIPDIKKLYNFCKKYFPEFKGFTFLKKNLYINDEELISFYFAYGIDHQSYEDFKSMSDFLKCNHISIENFVFNPNVVLVIDNDNK